MIRVNVFEMKAKLSDNLDRAARGERIVVCRHNKPVAELRPLVDARSDPRPIGPLPGRPRFEIASSFFDPMDDVDLDAWEGVTPAAPAPTADRGSKVAEGQGMYGGQPRSGARRRRT